jgi:hypothetical protein
MLRRSRNLQSPGTRNVISCAAGKADKYQSYGCKDSRNWKSRLSDADRRRGLLNEMALSVCHPIELLDESYRKAGFYSEGRD